jgi:hypothetical protein
MVESLRNTLFISCLLLASATTYGQQAVDETAIAAQQKPKTKLESFLVKDGAVIVRGFSTIGKINGIYGSVVSIDSKEFVDVATGQKQYGITVESKKPLGTSLSSVTREHTSYVDYDEIESLIAGLDYIAKLDQSVTKLDDFQADYKTKDDLKLSIFSAPANTGNIWGNQDKKGLFFSVESGSIGSVSAIFKLEAVKQFRDMLMQAKAKIDSIKNS